MKRWQSMAALFLIVVLLLGLSSLALANPIVLKLGHVLPTNEPIHQGFLHFAERVKERTNGQVEIQVYPSSELGSNKDTYEQALLGANVICHVDPGYLSDYAPDLGILNGPYLVKEPEEFNKVLDSEWFDGLKEVVRQKGFRILSFNWYFGSRHIISDLELRSPEDMVGVGVRVPPNTMWIETISAMGGSPNILEWAEVYSGLAQGVVDAAEAPLSTIYGSKLHETRNIISKTGHFKAITGIAIGEQFFQTLPKDIQDILIEEAQKAGDYSTVLVKDGEIEWEERLASEGVRFIDDVDIAAFQEATSTVYTKLEAERWTPGTYAQVTEALAK